VHPTLAPDCTLLLDLPVAVGLARSKERSGNIPRDRFEAEPAVFFERVRAAYLELARQEPKRFQIIDAGAPLPEVEEQVTSALRHILDST
jgi:dTMP kinase